MRKTIRAEALHPAAFVVDADQQVGPDRLDLRGQRGELGTVGPVAGKQDQATGQRVLQAAAIVRVQPGAGACSTR